MQWSLLVLIQMGQWAFIASLHYEYLFIKGEKTWKNARKHCRDTFTDLATVRNEADVQTLRQLAERKPGEDEDIWIGLSKGSSTKWHWSLPGVEDNEDQTNVISADSSDSSGKNCGMMTEQQWHAVSCTQRGSFICYDGHNQSDKFYLIDEEKSWPEAQMYCRQFHTDLVSGQNQLKDTKLINQIKQSNTKSWIIGLCRDEWSWSDGSDVSFTNWKDSDVDENGSRCATMDEQGKWEDADCSDKKPFFCYDDKVILIKEQKNWEKALKHCREHYSDLVSITSAAEQRRVQQRVSDTSTEFVWLGLRYTCTLDLWFWVNDKLVCYTQWEQSEGNSEGCDFAVAMNKRHTWSKKRDTETYPFICALQ